MWLPRLLSKIEGNKISLSLCYKVIRHTPDSHESGVCLINGLHVLNQVAHTLFLPIQYPTRSSVVVHTPQIFPERFLRIANSLKYLDDIFSQVP